MSNSLAASSVPENTLSEADTEKLWKAFCVFDTDKSGAISGAELGEVLRSLGQNPSAADLRDLIDEVDIHRSGNIDFGEFKTLMISRQGDRGSRLKLAFGVFDKDGSGRIGAEEMRSVMIQVGLTAAELDEMIKEVDEDGDGSIDFAEFSKLAPEAPARRPGESALSPAGSAAPLESPAATAAAIAGAVGARGQPSPEPAPDAPTPSVEAELARWNEQVARRQQEDRVHGTSILQLQIGVFRLIQGAAYRCFRESFSANHETHLRVRNLPYRITEFVPFVRTSIHLYKALGIVEEACHPALDAVIQSIDDEYERLQHRIANWQSIPKTEEMLAEHNAMVEARSRSANTREKFAAGIEFAITMQKQRLHLSNVVEGVLAVNELNRLREDELRQDLSPARAQSDGDPLAYLAKWNRVLLDNALETVDGAMMPVAYFYEDFMPKLLTAFTVSTAAQVATAVNLDEKVLNGWFDWMQSSGDFTRHGADVEAAFPRCSPAEKLRLLQGWWLTRHYLNGVQKRRERAEFGRESGGLAQYVSFIDVYLGRSDIRDSLMRVSFPYYIGPAVWRFLHTTAEIVCERPAAEQQALVATFKEFFKLFATMYPCPYCRHHLNAYVVQNREVDMYPVEYLLLGHDPGSGSFNMSIDDKLATVTDGPSLRMFLWKLHNTVSSSIARSEEWYHRDESAFYTTRYWPSMAAELARAKAFNHSSISVERIESNYQLLGPVGRLAGVRLELQRLLARGDTESIGQAKKIAQDYIRRLEASVLNGRFLQDNYRFEPDLQVDTLNPSVSSAEEELGRSGFYTEV